jgi:hypothetical protein
VFGGVDDGDLVTADVEGERPVLEPVDAGRALDVPEAQGDGDAGARLPVVLGTEVEPGRAEPVRADLDGRVTIIPVPTVARFSGVT